MIKLYITAIESTEKGGVTLFEEYQVNYEDKYDISNNENKNINKLVFEKIESMEEIIEQATNPF